MSDEIKITKLEKHVTKDIHDNHVNGSLIPVWRDWDKTITIPPKMVYVTSINPGEIKGPHLHVIRHSHYVCIKGKVVFIIKENRHPRASKHTRYLACTKSKRTRLNLNN